MKIEAPLLKLIENAPSEKKEVPINIEIVNKEQENGEEDEITKEVVVG